MSAARDTSAIALLSISKFFGATCVVDAADLTVGRGEIVALMGANGAGKSTLAKIAGGAVRPDRGTIAVGGRGVTLTSPRAARQAGIVTVHQSTEQLGVPGMTVAENLVLDRLCGGGSAAVLAPRLLRQQARQVAERIGLELPLDRDFGEVGPAHRQLIAIARAVGSEATVLILDEPTASLATTEAERLFDVIERLRARGVGVLYISHRLADLRRLADRVVVLRNGRVVAEQGRPLDLAGAVHAMIGRDLGAIAHGRAAASPGRLILRLQGVRLLPDSPPFDLSLHAGEILAVTGPLGSGKSRLLRSLFGAARLHGGRVEVEGARWAPASPAQAIAGGVFLAGQDRWRSSLLPATTPGADIAGTIALPHRRRWFPFGLVASGHEHGAATRAIDALGITARSSRDTLEVLSGGNQQKVVLARWQAASYRLLLLDEPFQGVDVGARGDLIEAIRSRRRRAATLLVTSDIEEAVEVADRVAVMRDHAVIERPGLRSHEAASLLGAGGGAAGVENPERRTPAGGP